MKRVPNNPAVMGPTGSLMLASALAIAAAQPVAAQSSPGGFSLPSPSPTPTSAPQGPADERSGVQIGPRVIRQPAPAPVPTPTPTPAATATAPAPTPTPAATQTRTAPAPTATRAPQRTPAPTPAARSTPAPSTSVPARNVPTVPQNAGAQGTEVPIDGDIGPGFETLPDGVEETDPVGPDDWYDVDSGASGADGVGYSEGGQAGALEAWDTTQNRIIGGIALLVLLLGAVAALIWRRRRRETVAQSTPNPGLASGIRNTITNQMPSVLQDTPNWAKDEPRAKAPATAPQPEPAPEPETPSAPDLDEVLEPEPAEEVVLPVAAADPAEPARIDLDLEVTSATRSLMMFTVDFRLEVANRSDNAVRDLSVAAKLTCAQRGGANAAPLAGGQPISAIERIGPQQSRSITGTLQLPLSEVTPIKQGSKPLLIPLLHLTLEGKGQRAMNRTFVLGTPSAAGTGRVHPLPLDGPPGGLPPLRAQVIKQPDVGDTQPA